MKKPTIIPKIAFGVACAALIFSIVTFIKTIVIHQTQYIWIAALQVFGSALIVGVCTIVIYLYKSDLEYEDDEENDDDKSEDDTQPTDSTKNELETEENPSTNEDKTIEENE